MITSLIWPNFLKPKSKTGSHKDNDSDTHTPRQGRHPLLFRDLSLLRTNRNVLLPPSPPSNTPLYSPPIHPPSCTHSGQHATVCRRLTSSLSLVSYLFLSPSPCEATWFIPLVCLESVWWWWTSKFIFLYIFAVCSVRIHACLPCRGWLFQCNYLFFCVVLSVFVSTFVPTFCGCFSACLSVCLFTLSRLISPPLLIYNVTLDLSLLPFHSHPQLMSLCLSPQWLCVAWIGMC